MTIDLTHITTIRRVAADLELGTSVPFAAFGVVREGIVVGRVGKPARGRTAAHPDYLRRDPVVAYRLPSHDPADLDLFRVLRNEAAAGRWLGQSSSYRRLVHVGYELSRRPAWP